MSVPPKTDNFDAWINRMPGSPPKLIVQGRVETDSIADLPVLVPNGDSRSVSTTLELDLLIVNNRAESDLESELRSVRYERPADPPYDKVLILWQDAVLHELAVFETQ